MIAALNWRCGGADPIPVQPDAPGFGSFDGAVCASVSLTRSAASPTAIGSPVTFTATANCQLGDSPEYLFLLKPVGSVSYTVVQPYSPDNSWTWSNGSFSSGAYIVLVFARAEGSTMTAESWRALQHDIFSAGAGTCNGPAEVTAVAAGANTINLSATATCSNGGVAEFQFYDRDPGASFYTMIRDWGGATYAWDTTGEPIGTHTLIMVTRAQGTALSSEAYDVTTVNIVVESCLGVTLDRSPLPPQSPGVTVTLTATPTCSGGASAEAKFMIRRSDQPTFVTLRDWGATSYEWDTSSMTFGTYYLLVSVRAEGNFTDGEGFVTSEYVFAPAELGGRCDSDDDCVNEHCEFGICVDPSGTTCAGDIQLIGSTFNQVRIHATSTGFGGPSSLVGDGNGVLYAHDAYGNGISNDRIHRIEPDGSVSPWVIWPDRSLCTHAQLTRDDAGNLYLPDVKSDAILRVDALGNTEVLTDTALPTAGGSCASDAAYLGLMSDASGGLVAASILNHNVVSISAGEPSAPHTITELATGFVWPIRLHSDGAGGTFLLDTFISGTTASATSTLFHISSEGAVESFQEFGAALGEVRTLSADGAFLYFTAGDREAGNSTLYRMHVATKSVEMLAHCLPWIADITFEKSTVPGAPRSVYAVYAGATISADDGDRIYEFNRP